MDLKFNFNLDTLLKSTGQNLNIRVGVVHMAPSDPNAYSTTVVEVLCLIVRNYFDYTPPRNREERNEFEKHLEKVGTLITGYKVGSLVITVKCDSLKSLEELWKEYSCGLLGKMVQDCFVTEKILKELNLAELKLKTTMDIEEYNAYKLYFLEKDALRGQLKERKRPGLSEKCFEMIKNTMHHSFNMVHHRVNTHVERVQVLIKIEPIVS